MNYSQWITTTSDDSTSNITYPNTWTVTPFIEKSRKCFICQNDITEKDKRIELIKVIPAKKKPGFLESRKTRRLYFHFSCYLNNNKRINKLLILEEIIE